MYFNDLLMKEITLNEFEASGALAMVNQILSWHGLALAMDHEGGVFGNATRLYPVKLKTNIMFDEEEVAAAKRRMNRYMFNNAKEMIENEKMEEFY
jgi:hypothetical protein